MGGGHLHAIGQRLRAQKGARSLRTVIQLGWCQQRSDLPRHAVDALVALHMAVVLLIVGGADEKLACAALVGYGPQLRLANPRAFKIRSGQVRVFLGRSNRVKSTGSHVFGGFRVGLLKLLKIY